MVSGAEQQICTTWSLRDTNKVQNNLTVTDDVIIYDHMTLTKLDNSVQLRLLKIG